jgi:hypothetical protein
MRGRGSGRAVRVADSSGIGDAVLVQPSGPPVGRSRGLHRSEIDYEAATLYAESVDSYGGSFYDDDADKIVLLFTGDPELHRAAIAQRTTTPEKFMLHRTSRSQAEITEASSQVVRLLLGKAELAEVTGVGPGLHGDEFVIEVGIDPYSEQIAATIHQLVAPEQIIVRYEPRASEF